MAMAMAMALVTCAQTGHLSAHSAVVGAVAEIRVGIIRVGASVGPSEPRTHSVNGPCCSIFNCEFCSPVFIIAEQKRSEAMMIE